MQNHRDRRRYLSLMVEINKRLDVLKDFQSGMANTTYIQTNVESQALQLRKILELIAYASLIPSRNTYERVRNDMQKDWHAIRILNNIDAIHPHFYPIPLERGYKWKRKHGGFLPKKQFIALYDSCGNILHAKNPFSRHSQHSLAFGKRVAEHILRIENLLSEHFVHLISTHMLLYVRFPKTKEKPFIAAWISPLNLSER